MLFPSTLSTVILNATARGKVLTTGITPILARGRHAKPFPFSAADPDVLERFNIVLKGILYLRPKDSLQEAINASSKLGSNQLWSNENMYKHLNFITNSFINIIERPCQMAIDTFFFRSAVMVPASQKTVMMQDDHVPAVHLKPLKLGTISGAIDYTAVVMKPSAAEDFILTSPSLLFSHRHEMISFFLATKAMPVTVNLQESIPQVVLELVACAKHFGKSHIRGALTTGFQWQFVVVDISPDGAGAAYWVSEPIEWMTKRSEEIGKRVVKPTFDLYDPALIAGILSTWIPKSFMEFNDDQWLARRVAVR